MQTFYTKLIEFLINIYNYIRAPIVYICYKLAEFDSWILDILFIEDLKNSAIINFNSIILCNEMLKEVIYNLSTGNYEIDICDSRYIIKTLISDEETPMVIIYLNILDINQENWACKIEFKSTDCLRHMSYFIYYGKNNGDKHIEIEFICEFSTPRVCILNNPLMGITYYSYYIMNQGVISPIYFDISKDIGEKCIDMGMHEIIDAIIKEKLPEIDILEPKGEN